MTFTYRKETKFSQDKDNYRDLVFNKIFVLENKNSVFHLNLLALNTSLFLK